MGLSADTRNIILAVLGLLAAILAFILYLMEKANKSSVVITLILLVFMAGCLLTLFYLLPWVWTGTTALMTWRVCLITAIVLLSVARFGIWIWPHGQKVEPKVDGSGRTIGEVIVAGAEPTKTSTKAIDSPMPKSAHKPQNNGPRTLKAAVIANTMKDFKTVMFRVENSSTTETFSEELVAALQLAKLNAASMGTIVDPPRFAFQGIKIECNEYELSPDDVSGKAADALVRELRAENFVANRIPPRGPAPNFVRIVIGDRQ